MPGQWNCQTGSPPDDPTRAHRREAPDQWHGRIQHVGICHPALLPDPSRSHRKSRSGCCPQIPQHGNDLLGSSSSGSGQVRTIVPSDRRSTLTPNVFMFTCASLVTGQTSTVHEPERPVQADHFAVQHLVAENAHYKFAYSSGVPSRGETVSLPRGFLRGLRQHGRFEYARRDGNDSNAEPCSSRAAGSVSPAIAPLDDE